MNKVCWEDIHSYIDRLSEFLKSNYEISKIPGIFTFPRGGLILAVLLSYKLNLPILTNPQDGCIIIDDICDSGITLKKYSDLKDKKNYIITCLFIKQDQLDGNSPYPCKLDFYDKIKYDDWIEYPWE